MTATTQPSEALAKAKTPRTERGRKTLRLILDAAAEEFGARGYHEGSIARIAQRAGVAIGSFYTYFDSKEAVFRALVADMSRQVQDHVVPVMLAAPDRLAAERVGLAAFLDFVRNHKSLYRIIDESAFVAEDAYRRHYVEVAEGYARSLEQAFGRGEVSDGDWQVRAWAIMGMNVFLGLKFGVWDDSRPVDEIAAAAHALITNGLAPRA
ncbi:TetR/AcrR family transcriptional regulator [Sandarakinorhabdus limnophila]|uniref:TetR/AcrR family transcriptional regulator n=1 Tax=Sandarakinorhabdus limnophila TaxID=210512 RepID=UPI0026F03DAE|nr:TetR/AcrR family transcriptional regulator [Sandarakinorhabdus limnophila]MCM0033469.1 TetR/AcrR family transcriptional regulator [Sandarakinorhabdus limnophila]